MADLGQKQTLSEGVVTERATGDYSAKKAAAGKDIGKPGKNFEKIAKSAGERYGSKAAGERVAGAVLNKLRNPKEDVDESALQGYLGKKKYGDEGMKALQQAGRDNANTKTMNNIRNKYDKYDEGMGMTDEGNAFAKAVVDAKQDGIQPGEKIRVGGKDIPLKEKLSPARQKSFAALAPPRDKITFADKIAGAKKEVDEMLGDVAAEAMKSAVKTMHGTADMAEDFDDMQRDVKKRMGPKVGDVRRGARHDIETTATGIRATRRQDDETDDRPTGEKRRAGRPKGADKGPERVTGKAYKHKGGRVKEGNMSDMIEPYDADEYDSEGDMAKEQLHTMKLAAMELSSILSDDENLPEWVQSKITKALDYVDTARDYMISTKADRGMTMDEEKTSTRDNRAERAGKKVAKDIEYDEKKKDGIHGKKRGAEDSKAERAGKTVAKDIEYDEKKKEKKVDETTTSGSVATGGDAPKATKGGMQVGKGIYDSMNREVENMIAESMSINVSMSSDDNGSHKNITVTASDEDAEALAQLLRSAGLGGDMSPDHGMAEAYGDVTATENKPDYPTDTEYSDDAMQYSGGLNGPKSTGQTTIPVIAHQGARTGIDDEELRRMMEMAGIKQQELQPYERTMKEEEAVEEGVADTVKDAVKKGLEKLGHGSDEDMRKDLQKKMGVPPTGEKPKDDKKMEESLMQEFANFKI